MRFAVRAGLIATGVGVTGCGRGWKPIVRSQQPLAALHGVDGSSLANFEADVLRCEATFSTFSVPHSATCPPEEFRLSDGTKVVPNRLSVIEGSESRVFQSADNELIVKVLGDGPLARPGDEARVEVFMRWLYAGLCRERVIGSIIGDLGGKGARMHAIPPGELAPACAAATLVFDNGGEYDMQSMVSLGISEKGQAAVVAAAIRILRAVHANGIIHGDVKDGNFVFSSIDRPAETLRVIDFGRATPFVDPLTGGHVPESAMERAAFVKMGPLSVWELEGVRPSRRDDMIRLAQWLLRILGFEARDEAACERGMSVAGCVAAKGELRTEGGKVAGLYNAMLQLQFADRPDYEYWIAVFESAAKDGSLLAPPWAEAASSLRLGTE